MAMRFEVDAVFGDGFGMNELPANEPARPAECRHSSKRQREFDCVPRFPRNEGHISSLQVHSPRRFR